MVVIGKDCIRCFSLRKDKALQLVSHIMPVHVPLPDTVLVGVRQAMACLIKHTPHVRVPLKLVLLTFSRKWSDVLERRCGTRDSPCNEAGMVSDYDCWISDEPSIHPGRRTNRIDVLAPSRRTSMPFLSRTYRN